MTDTIQRFLFEHAPVRGEIVHLDATWRAVLSRHDYPLPVRALLGEMMAAAALLTATLKFGGTLIMQIQGGGPVQLLVVECTSDHHMRATAKWSQLPANGDLRTLVGDGKFAITLDPGQGRTGYQGVVALEGASVAAALESYMARSEQIETRLWLGTGFERRCWRRLSRRRSWSRTTHPPCCGGSIPRKTSACSSRGRSHSAARARANA